MDCSNRIFVLHEKDGDRYIKAINKELTARAIVRGRVDDGYWYNEELNKKLLTKLNSNLPLMDKTFYTWLLNRTGEYEKVTEHYLEDLIE